MTEQELPPEPPVEPPAADGWPPAPMPDMGTAPDVTGSPWLEPASADETPALTPGPTDVETEEAAADG